MKTKRQQMILELIEKFSIDTQEELIARLREHGYDATQATISRDIRELKIAKMTTGKGTYRYVLPKHVEAASSLKFSNALVDSIISVDYVNNMIVLKTYPGMANAMAVGIDGMNMDRILGCVAGDDTILIITRSNEDAESISDRLHDLLRNF